MVTEAIDKVYTAAYARANPNNEPITMRYHRGWWVIKFNEYGPESRYQSKTLSKMSENLTARAEQQEEKLHDGLH